MPVEPEPNLQWTAFLYISGELSSENALEFERLLVEDQSAREAVASAVELVQMVGLVGPEAESLGILTKRTQFRRRITWAVSMAAAAALILAVLIPTFRATGKVEPDASAVALTWSGLRDGINADWKAVVAGPDPSESTDSPLLADSDLADETATERPLPSWLLSAASGPRTDSPLEEN
jgi:hypothetical protein